MIDIQLSTIKDLGQWWIQVTKVSLLNENWANETLSCFVQVEFSCRLKRWNILERTRLIYYDDTANSGWSWTDFL